MSLVALKTAADGLDRAEHRADHWRARRDEQIVEAIASGAHSQEEVAKAAGVSDAYVRKVLRAAHPA